MLDCNEVINQLAMAKQIMLVCAYFEEGGWSCFWRKALEFEVEGECRRLKEME